MRALLEMERQLVLVGHLRNDVLRVGSGQRRPVERLTFKILLIVEMHRRIRLFVVLKLSPRRQGIIGGTKTGVIVPVATWRGSKGLDM